MTTTRCACCDRSVTVGVRSVDVTVAVLCEYCSMTHKLVAVRKYPTPWDGGDLQPRYYPPMWESDPKVPPLDQTWVPPIPVTC